MRNLHCATCGAFVAALDDRLHPVPPASWCRDCSMPAYARLAREGSGPLPPVAGVLTPRPPPRPRAARERVLAQRAGR